MKIKLQVHPGDKGEKKHSRRYFSDDKDAPVSDIYVRRPFSTKKDKLTLILEDGWSVELTTK